MANIKSQIKRNRQNDARHERNKAVRSALKTASKKVHAAVSGGETDVALAEARVASGDDEAGPTDAEQLVDAVPPGDRVAAHRVPRDQSRTGAQHREACLCSLDASAVARQMGVLPLSYRAP